jgi:hypothetical protein
MRIVPRESIPEAKVLRLAGSDRPVEVEAVIDVNGRVKVLRVIDVDNGQPKLAKVTGRYDLLPNEPGNKQHLA